MQVTRSQSKQDEPVQYLEAPGNSKRFSSCQAAGGEHQRAGIAQRQPALGCGSAQDSWPQPGNGRRGRGLPWLWGPR